jgi:hypothetical protein
MRVVARKGARRVALLGVVGTATTFVARLASPLSGDNAIHVGMNQGFPKQETIMKSDLMGLLLLLSVGMAQAAQPELERPIHVPALQTMEAAAPRSVRPQTSPARKAEISRRMFLLLLCLR